MPDTHNHYVVIMAGGRGERFWPQSRLKRPKQLLPIVGDSPLITQTVERLSGLVPSENILIITNREQRDAVIEVCPMLPPENIIGEPLGRDTAAAVGLAMILVSQRDPHATFAMLPADHIIHDATAFRSVLSAAFTAAAQDKVLVTLGIKPHSPATGYGYIQHGDKWTQCQGRDVYRVRAFKEKPDADTAQRYLDSGDYHWNAGMFLWTVEAIRDALHTHTPSLSRALKAIEAELTQGHPIDTVLDTHYPQLDKISIDYAIMEKAPNTVTLEAAFDWDDVGEWPAVARHHQPDPDNNILKGDALALDARNNIIISPEGHLTAVLGSDDLIVVHTPDATLVCPKSRAQDIKKLVKQLENHPRWKTLI